MTIMHTAFELHIVAETLNVARMILALQWALGNVLMLALFGAGVSLFIYARKAVNAFKPKEYKLPFHWFYGYIALIVISMLLFNVLPNTIKMSTQSESFFKSLKVAVDSATANSRK